jgi:hypothetical protein
MTILAAALVAALAALAGPAAPAPAKDQTHMEPFWLDATGSKGEADRTVQALLSTPPGWMVGDAAVVVLSDGPWPGQAREQFVAALLDEEAAVLELDVNSALRLASEGTRAGRLPPPTAAAELVPHVRGAAEALRKDAGAGLVVAVGYGAGGEAAALAASLERSMPPVGGPGLVAAASLGPEPARFALGGADPGRGWAIRAGRLCEVLAAAVASQPRAEAECVRALAGPAEAYAARAAKR